MMRFSFNWRFLPPVTAAAVLVILFGLNTQTAFADPHAVFYTVSGQQQLFFNMLAALDQADYVEPAKPTVGLPSGESREKWSKVEESFWTSALVSQSDCRLRLSERCTEFKCARFTRMASKFFWTSVSSSSICTPTVGVVDVRTALTLDSIIDIQLSADRGSEAIKRQALLMIVVVQSSGVVVS